MSVKPNLELNGLSRKLIGFISSYFWIDITEMLCLID